jgi:hypothetical protein
MSDRTERLIGLYATVAAFGAAVIAPLLALAYFHIPDGAGSLDQSTVSAWADPASKHLHALISFASRDRVYTTYTQAIGLLFPAVLLCALVTRSHRPAGARGSERWGWRIALAGYGIACAGLTTVSLLEIGADPNGSSVNAAFLALMLPGMLLSVIGSTVLGIGLLRGGYAPRLTAWLLALMIPLMILGSGVLGHNSIGMVPLFAAWGITGWTTAGSRGVRRKAHDDARTGAPRPARP